MCDDKVAMKDYFMLKCCLDKYKTHEVCDKVADAFLMLLLLTLFITSNVIKKIWTKYPDTPKSYTITCTRSIFKTFKTFRQFLSTLYGFPPNYTFQNLKVSYFY